MKSNLRIVEITKLKRKLSWRIFLRSGETKRKAKLSDKHRLLK